MRSKGCFQFLHSMEVAILDKFHAHHGSFHAHHGSFHAHHGSFHAHHGSFHAHHGSFHAHHGSFHFHHSFAPMQNYFKYTVMWGHLNTKSIYWNEQNRPV